VLVRLDRHGPVALVTLDRPEKRNALSVALRRELAACFRALASDRDACAMVLTGAGTAFCAGMDRSEFGGDADHRRDLFESSKELFGRSASCRSRRSRRSTARRWAAARRWPRRATPGWRRRPRAWVIPSWRSLEMARHGRAVLEATKRIIIETARGGAAARAWEAELRLFRQALFAGR